MRRESERESSPRPEERLGHPYKSISIIAATVGFSNRDSSRDVDQQVRLKLLFHCELFLLQDFSNQWHVEGREKELMQKKHDFDPLKKRNFYIHVRVDSPIWSTYFEYILGWGLLSTYAFAWRPGMVFV
jgi:hypothetical protein